MHLKRWAKSMVERSLGVTIMRGPPIVINQKSDAAVRALRRWAPDDVVFDVGANDGRTILRIVDQLSFPRIFAFEPVSDTYRLLSERTAHLSNVRCFQLAMGAAAGQQTINLNPIHEMNSFLKGWAPATGTERVEVTTIDGFIQQHGIDFVHFLKIDTEGYEMEVLRGAQRALAESRIALLQVEAGFAQSHKQLTSLEELRCHLAPFGYRLYGIYTQARAPGLPPAGWPAAEIERYDPQVLVYCDALFIRAELASGTDTVE